MTKDGLMAAYGKVVVEEFQLGQIGFKFYIDGPASGSPLTVFEFTVPPGAKVPMPHSHDAFDEMGYGLEGVLTFSVGDEVVELGPGDVGFIPRGVVHGFKNLHAETARCLAVITPGVLGSAFFKEMGEVAKAAAGGPPDPSAMAAVMRRHGLTPASPGA
jgi:quercetin dioxygenase-like cupin family protein